MIKRIKGDIWDFHEAFVVIPVNLEGVCGRGLAKQMVDRFPKIGASFREVCRTGSYAVTMERASKLPFWSPEVGPNFEAGSPYYRIVPFPVKRSWKDEGSLEIISRSTRQLVQLLQEHRVPFFCILPMVGCGFGELKPEQVLPILEEITAPVQDRVLLIEPDPAVFQRYPTAFKAGWREDRSAVQANMPVCRDQQCG
jgi:hypothetical protein